MVAATVGGGGMLFTLNLTTGVAMVAGSFASPIVALTTNGAQTASVFGVTTTNRLVSFAPALSGTVTVIGTLNVPAGETVQGIDCRPSIGPRNNVLTALTTAAGGAARLYAVNVTNAQVTLLGTLAASPERAGAIRPLFASWGSAAGAG